MLGFGLGWLELGLPFFFCFLSALFQRTTLVLVYLLQNNRALSPFLSPGGYCPAGASVVTLCPAGSIGWDAIYHFSLLSGKRVLLLVDVLCLVLVVHRMESPSPFVCAPKHLSSNRLTRTLDYSLLQGHILPTRGPRHPRHAPLVLQVLMSLSNTLASLVYSLHFLSSCLVDFYLYFIPLFFSIPPLFSLLPPCLTLFLFPFSSPFAPTSVWILFQLWI